MRAPACARSIAAALVAASVAASALAAGDAPLATHGVASRRHAQVALVEASVEAVRQATIGTQVSGRIVELPVKAGDAVRAGQVLARIDPRAADAAVAAGRSQVAEAEANLANARRAHERNVELAARKFVSQAAVDQSEAAYKAALAQAEAVRANASSAVVQRD